MQSRDGWSSYLVSQRFYFLTDKMHNRTLNLFIEQKVSIFCRKNGIINKLETDEV